MKLDALKSKLIAKASGLDNPSLEVRILIEKACGLSLKEQILNPDLEITDDKAEEIDSMLDKRLSGFPMAYIIGEKEFYGLTFKVTPDVLIPRPDTEIIVQKAIEIAKSKKKESNNDIAILDLCTGSGAIATAIAYETGEDVSFSDVSQRALDIAIYNYKNIIGRTPNARLGSLFSPWEKAPFDIIVTNPPYLTDKWYLETAIEVKKEPKLALLGHGDDGLDLIRSIIVRSV